MLLTTIVFFPFAGAILISLPGKKPGRERLQDRLASVCTAVELLLCLMLPVFMPEGAVHNVLASGLHFETDGFRCVYAIITAVMWLGTTLFSQEYFEEERRHIGRYRFFILATLGATEGVMLSADFMTAFVFFEILSLTSFTWVIHEETKEAVKAGYTYLFIAVIGGLILFMGLLLLQNEAGTLQFSELTEAVQNVQSRGRLMAAGVCILLGFGAKAGMFPLHIWLPKAHPVAPSPASALLSGILTKVGIYGILMTALHVLYGESQFGLLVLGLGTVTMFLGALLALFSVNLKRTLACSSMSQIGFILTGTGMYVLLTAGGAGEEAYTALSGLMLHMVNHSLIKLTLFMAAGVVVMNLHTLTLDDIRGWGKNKLFLKLSFALGALGISGVPLFNGYISKTLLHEGIVEGTEILLPLAGILKITEWIFLISGGLTFAYMVKLFICIFVESNRDAKKQAQFDREGSSYMNQLSTVVIFGSSLAMLILGQPVVMKALAAFMTGNNEILHFRAFSWENLKGGLISLCIGAVVYLLIVRKVLYKNGSYLNLWPEKLDLEEMVYKPVLMVCVLIATFVGRVMADSLDALLVLLRKTLIRQIRTRHIDSEKIGWFASAREVTAEAVEPLLNNFTFALMMTCIGILLILGVLVLLTVFHI